MLVTSPAHVGPWLKGGGLGGALALPTPSPLTTLSISPLDQHEPQALMIANPAGDIGQLNVAQDALTNIAWGFLA